MACLIPPRWLVFFAPLLKQKVQDGFHERGALSLDGCSYIVLLDLKDSLPISKTIKEGCLMEHPTMGYLSNVNAVYPPFSPPDPLHHSPQILCNTQDRF